jgi:hypothetical protein
MLSPYLSPSLLSPRCTSGAAERRPVQSNGKGKRVAGRTGSAWTALSHQAHSGDQWARLNDLVQRTADSHESGVAARSEDEFQPSIYSYADIGQAHGTRHSA